MQRSTLKTSLGAELKFFFEKYTRVVPRLILVSSVAPSNNDRLKRMLRSLFNAKVYFAHTSQFTFFLHPKVDAQQTGVDRVIGAFQASSEGKKSVVYIDAGSAITIDVVHKGRFKGGVIIPGIQMGRRSLLTHTEMVRPKNLQNKIKSASLIGRNTTECVDAYAYRALPLMIDGYIRSIRAELRTSLRIIASGGDAATLATHSKYSWQINRGLLLKGLGRSASVITNQP